MSYQSEYQLEQKMLSSLTKKHKYKYVKIKNEKELEANFREQLNKLNIKNLNNKPLTDKEFERVLIYLKGKSIFQSAKQLRDKYSLQRDNGEFVYIKFIDFEVPSNNIFQVSNQITMRGKYENRYDVTILINGLPIVQIELKRRGMHIKRAFDQICRYARHSYKGLFRYLQILVISNGVDTKYFANTDKPYKYDFTFFWTDEKNKRITTLCDFTDAFLNQSHLLKMLDTYTILNDTEKTIMIMRPYQVYAVKNLVKVATETANGGYIWHSTGSGKTLTSFKASQILAKDPSIKKVIFLVDRSDLDMQTVQEFNKFAEGSIDSTGNTKTLVKQMANPSVPLIVTTVQKLDIAIKNKKYERVMKQYENEKVIIIVDECHRSQFGKMHTRIRKFFKKAQFFGFTGTPRFKENKSQDGRTTADIFGRCLHTYMIKEAIHDRNVLGFSVEYIETFKGQYDEEDEEKVYDIDKKEVYESDERISMVANHIVEYHNTKTLQRKYTALFATSSIPMLIRYYDKFKEIDHDLSIAAIYSFQDNTDMEGKAEYPRESLEKIIADYNKTFGTNYSTNTFESYKADISRRIKNKQIDILIVVNMFLTGFDSKLTNTLYLDKELRYHDLLQAFSRTNRVYEPTKVWGNIVCYRNLKRETDEAIRLFNMDDDVNTVLQKDYETYVKEFKKYLEKMYGIVEKPEDVDALYEESKQKEFVLTFKSLAQTLLALQTFVDFEFEKDVIGIDEQTYEDFKSKYLLLYDKVKRERTETEKVSILDDIDFGIELIQTDRINVEYIMNLIRSVDREDKKKQQKDIEHILKELDRTDNPQLKRKVDLIKEFLLSELPSLTKDDNIDNIYNEFEDKVRNREIVEFAKEKDIDVDVLKEEISEYEFTGVADRERISNKIKKPYLEKRQLVKDIIDFIRENVLKYQR